MLCFFSLPSLTHSNLKGEIFNVASQYKVCMFKTVCIIIGVVGSRCQGIVPQCKTVALRQTDEHMNTTLQYCHSSAPQLHNYYNHYCCFYNYNFALCWLKYFYMFMIFIFKLWCKNVFLSPKSAYYNDFRRIIWHWRLEEWLQKIQLCHHRNKLNF